MLLLFAFIITSTAFADEKQDFREAYRAYQQYVKAGDTAKAKEMAAESYRLGGGVYGKDSVNTSKLAINYASLLNDAGSFRQARKVLKGKLGILEREYGVNAVELSSILIELGRAELDLDDPDMALGQFSRSSRLLEKHENALYRAKKNLDIAIILLKRNGGALTREYIEAAHAVYSRDLPTSDFRRGLTSYHMARHAIEDQQYERAAAHLESCLIAFKSGDGTMSRLERTVRVQLVNAYESLQRQDAATEHCLAIGNEQRWELPADPLYRTKPVPSLAAMEAGLTGEVTLAFAVDSQGYVVNPRVKQSTTEAFNEAALDMIRQFRYAPRFIENKPVLTEGVEYTVRFAPNQVKEKRRRIPGFDGFGRPPTRWRLEQGITPSSQNPGGK